MLMTGLIKKIINAANLRTTYRIGLLQTKAYRILKQHTAETLSPYGISTIEWAFLGLLHDAPEGMRSKAAADEIGVEAPFITAMVASLRKKDLVLEGQDKKDSRAKNLSLTEKGHEFVIATEKILKESVRGIMKGIGAGDIVSYLAVLKQMVDNGGFKKPSSKFDI